MLRFLFLLILLFSSISEAAEFAVDKDTTVKFEFRPNVVNSQQKYSLRIRLEHGSWYVANTARTEIDDGYVKPYTYDKLIFGYKASDTLIIRAVTVWNELTFWNDHINTSTLNLTILY